jgi:hypothetical protein
MRCAGIAEPVEADVKGHGGDRWATGPTFGNAWPEAQRVPPPGFRRGDVHSAF